MFSQLILILLLNLIDTELNITEAMFDICHMSGSLCVKYLHILTVMYPVAYLDLTKNVSNSVKSLLPIN